MNTKNLFFNISKIVFIAYSIENVTIIGTRGHQLVSMELRFESYQTFCDPKQLLHTLIKKFFLKIYNCVNWFIYFNTYVSSFFFFFMIGFIIWCQHCQHISFPPIYDYRNTDPFQLLRWFFYRIINFIWHTYSSYNLYITNLKTTPWIRVRKKKMFATRQLVTPVLH